MKTDPRKPIQENNPIAIFAARFVVTCDATPATPPMSVATMPRVFGGRSSGYRALFPAIRLIETIASVNATSPVMAVRLLMLPHYGHFEVKPPFFDSIKRDLLKVYEQFDTIGINFLFSIPNALL